MSSITESAGENVIIELNVGGQIYTSTTSTLIKKRPTSKLALLTALYLKHLKCRINGTTVATNNDDDRLPPILQDSENRLFIDRDGAMFRHVLDFLRWCEDSESETLNFGKFLSTKCEKERLKVEADFYGIVDLSQHLEVAIAQTQIQDLKIYTDPAIDSGDAQCDSIIKSDSSPSRSSSCQDTYPSYLTIGYRSVYESPRPRNVPQQTTDVTLFRRVTRITVSGRADAAREVFKDDLNESRDPNRSGDGGYTCRYYLKHTYLEAAFEALAAIGYQFAGVNTISSSNETQTRTDSEALFYRNK